MTCQWHSLPGGMIEKMTWKCILLGLLGSQKRVKLNDEAVGVQDLGSASTLGAVLFAQSLAHAALCKAGWLPASPGLNTGES